jgi:hypothetical protein
MLTLAEELVLLAITQKGDVAPNAYIRLDNGVAGARLMELALQRRIGMEGEAIAVADPAPTGDAATDAVLAAIADGERGTAQDWIGRLAGMRPQATAIEALRDRGILGEERGRVLGLFKRTRHPEVDPEPERQVRERLRAMLVEGRDPDARTAALAVLVDATDLLSEVFPDEAERRAAEGRLAALRRGDALRDALGAANDATVQAVLVSVTAAVTAAVVAATSAAAVAT